LNVKSQKDTTSLSNQGLEKYVTSLTSTNNSLGCFSQLKTTVRFSLTKLVLRSAFKQKYLDIACNIDLGWN
jgi:hypothetical protein